ncbi:interleukin-6 receptor subunit beta isoform X2 [Rhinoderma darwinii]|uniref:interleukin-6 receptor subunit beta isoform X2 n=1 Tax=Rhinoderma darwinii TaxID=43563 RepID=UPI003F66332D
MRRLSIFCVLVAILFAVDGRVINSCVQITPQSPAVELNTNLTAYCFVNQTCLDELNYRITSKELFWKVGNQVIPESQYTVINDRVSSVTFEPTLSMHNSLICSFKAYGQTEVTLHGIFFSLGYPPEKPENLTCISYNGKTLTCTWDPGRPTIIPTKYTLKQSWAIGPQKGCTADVGSNFCTLQYPDFILHIDTTFMVVAENVLGKAESDLVLFDIVHIVKPNPPEIVSVSAVLQKVLRIEWKNPMEINELIYNLRYKPKGSTEWNEVPSDDIKRTRTSFALQGLQSYTEYVISLRCKPQIKGFWSEWSKEYTATTSESTPSQGPDLWRKICKTESDGRRVIQLMWKDLKSHSNGIILGYNVTLKKGPEVVDSFTVKDMTCNVTVSKDSYEVVLTAYNSEGTSPPSTLIIPSLTDKKDVQPADMNFKAFPKDGQLWVEWTPSGRVLGYVIEWCSNHESMDCNIEWQREPRNTEKTFLRGDIKPFVYYLIKLNPLHKDGQERSSYMGTYLQQRAPELGPAVQTKSSGKTWVTLVWTPVPLQERNGFITNYTIKYQDKYGPPKEITVNATVTEYTLKSLAAKTTYSVSVTANTEKDGKAGLPLTFTTLPFDNGEVEAIVVSSCLGFLVFILVLCFVFCNKREQIKKHIWPNVPDPSKSNIAQWSPQTPTRHESKQPPFQDGPFTDVSVVEITANEKKSYSDQDLKSLDQVKKNTSEGLSSGIGGSSCLSSPRLSVSDSDEVSCAQNTSSTVQYSTVIMGGYQGQTPIFSRSESTQPLLISEERPDEQPQVLEEDTETQTPSQYFKQNFTQGDAGKVQALQQEDPHSAHTPEPAAQVLHLAGFSHGHDNLDFNPDHNVNPNSLSQADALNDEQKMYIPQSVRQGGYIPQ